MYAADDYSYPGIEMTQGAGDKASDIEEFKELMISAMAIVREQEAMMEYLTTILTVTQDQLGKTKYRLDEANRILTELTKHADDYLI